MLNYKSVLFDLDGTLLDTSGGVIKSVEYLINELSLPQITEEVKRSFIGPPIQASLKRVYGMDGEEVRAATKVFRDRYSTVDLCIAAEYAGIRELLSLLRQKGIKIGVATYKRQDYAEEILRAFHIAPLCDCIYGADYDGKYTKQDIINLCIEHLADGDKSHTVMIGDSEFDALGAQQAGVDFIGVTYGFGFRSKDEVAGYPHVAAAGDVAGLIKLFS